MACTFRWDMATGLTTSYSTYNNTYAALTNLELLVNGYSIPRISVRFGTAASAACPFRYIVLSPVSGSVFQAAYVSETLTHTASVGTETFTFSSPYTVPASGAYYGAIQQQTVFAPWIANSLTTGGYPGDIYRAALANWVVQGNQYDFGTILTTTAGLLFSEEQCSPSTSLTSVNMSSSSAIEAPVLTVTKQFTAADLTSSTACDASTNVVTIVLTSASLSAGSASGDPVLTMEGQRVPAAMGVATAVTDATFVITRILVPADMSVATLATASTFNHAFTLYPANLSVRAETQTVLNGSLENMRLSSKSSRTPDAGIKLSWEEFGVPKAYSWYDKTLYQFHLDFAQITEEECAWLQEYCRLHRYDEIDYVWPFNGHTYRCILTNDVSETIIRSDAALGIRCTAAVDLLGYDIA